MLSRHPGLLLAAAFALGLCSAANLSVDLVLALCGALLASLARFAWRRRGKPGPPWLERRWLLRLLAAMLLGWWRGGEAPPAEHGGMTPRPARVEGTVVVPPLVTGSPGRLSPLTRLGLETDNGASIDLTIPGTIGGLRGGDRLRATGLLASPARPRNPGDPPAAPSRWRLEAPAAAAVEKLAPGTSPWRLRALGAVRERLYRVVETLYDEPCRGFVLAMLLGERRLLDPELRESLVLTGTFHVLAISGFHVVVVMFLALRVPLPPGARLPFRLACLGLFTALTGASPPVARAAVMFLIDTLLERLGRSPRALNTLGWSALVLLGGDPGLLWDLGFQLSFVAVASILTLGARLVSRASHLRPPWRQLAAPLLLATGAALGTAPLTLWRFHRLHPLGPLWNLLATPLTLVPLVGGGLSVALGLLHPAMGMPIAFLVEQTSGLLLVALELGARVPGSAVSLPAPPGWTVALSYGLLLARQLLSWRTWRWIAAAGLMLVCAATWIATTAPQVWILDAGAGDAALLRFPGVGGLLIDAGVRGHGGPAEEALTRAAFALGQGRLRGIYLTHGHADHLRGLGGVARRLGVEAAWVPRGFEQTPSGRLALEELARHGIPATAVGRGHRLGFDGAPLAIETLFPPSAGVWQFRGPNDLSLALRVEWRGSRILFLGDLEEKGASALLATGEDLRAGVLLAPHHGRANLLWPALLERVKPRTVVISGNGAGGGRETAAWLEARGVRVLATWRAGAIVLRWEEPRGWLANYCFGDT